MSSVDVIFVSLGHLITGIVMIGVIIGIAVLVYKLVTGGIGWVFDQLTGGMVKALKGKPNYSDLDMRAPEPQPPERPPVSPAILFNRIDEHPAKLTDETRAAFKKVAENILQEDPALEDKLFQAYASFADDLPDEYKNDGTRQFAEAVGASLPPQVINTLYFAALKLPGTEAQRQLGYLVDARERKTEYWLDLRKLDNGDPGERLSYVLLSPLHPVAETLKPIVRLPRDTRFEHMWVLGPQGSGKTQTLQWLISEDLEKDCSIMVIDSQGDLIRQVATLKDIQSRVVLVEPGKVALNPFDMKGEQAIDLLTFVFSSFGEGAEMTPKQQTLYRYGIRLMQLVPEATLMTFVKLLQHGQEPYAEYITKLPEPARLFFETQFDDAKLFGQTKQELSWRLMMLLENETFARMFNAPHTRIDLFKELNEGKVILVDTNKEMLGTERSALFGRFFIALLLLASQKRAGIARADRLPTYVFIDEAHEYLQDDKVAEILDQARKMRIGMTLANQRSQQISNPNMLDALLTTSIKLVHTDNDRDTHLLARPMKTEPEMFGQLPKGVFAAFIRKETPHAIPIRIPFLVLENAEHVSIEPLREKMRMRYGPTVTQSVVDAVSTFQATVPEPVEETPPTPPPSEPDTKPTDW